MAKCPKCSTRKGKRSCPGLGTEICALCCAENRLKTIRCPQDCPHLRGEIYQHDRRKARALSEGKRFMERQEKLFPEKVAREFAFRLQADIYFFCREHGAVDDGIMAECLENLESFLSKIFVPPAAPHPLARFLIERLGDEKRYGSLPGLTAEDRRRAIKALAVHARSLARKGGRILCEEISDFFDPLDFEADLDYSPGDSGTAKDGDEPMARSPGGLILPP